jgi:hypothetical protein
MIKHAMLAISFRWSWPRPGRPRPYLQRYIQVKKGGKHGGHGHHNRHYNAHRHYNHHRHYNRHYHYNRHHHYRGRYWYGGRYWGRRYYYRPYSWQTWGCIRVGPIWYCP